jgi:hypothetical protein
MHMTPAAMIRPRNAMLYQMIPLQSRLQYSSSSPLDECVQTNLLVYARGGRLFFTKSAASFNGGTQSRGVSNPIVPLCQFNNHPDFRLRLAKERMALDLATDGCAAKTEDETQIKRSKILNNKKRAMNENPVRPNDGTSSGAIAADRLRNARRNAIENMIESIPKKCPIRPRRTTSFSQKNSNHLALSTKERDLVIQFIENPVRSNDGTSSGALVADRLRQSRRKAIEKMNTQLSINQVTQTDTSATPTLGKERGIKIQMIENPARSSDGTSSGAIAADRLRMSRREALERIKNQHHFRTHSDDDT